MYLGSKITAMAINKLHSPNISQTYHSFFSVIALMYSFSFLHFLAITSFILHTLDRNKLEVGYHFQFSNTILVTYWNFLFHLIIHRVIHPCVKTISQFHFDLWNIAKQVNDLIFPFSQLDFFLFFFSQINFFLQITSFSQINFVLTFLPLQEMKTFNSNSHIARLLQKGSEYQTQLCFTTNKCLNCAVITKNFKELELKYDELQLIVHHFLVYNLLNLQAFISTE